MDDLTPDWNEWLQSNVQRGVANRDLVATLIEAGHSREASWELVVQARRRPEAIVDAHPTTMPRDRVRWPLVQLMGPALAVFADVLAPDECASIISLASARIGEATVVDPKTGETHASGVRRSETAYFARGESDFIDAIERRINWVAGIPEDQGEPLQVVRYGVGGEYRPHFDYFDPDTPGSQTHLARGGQRVATMIVYLDDVLEGGETVFPELGLSVSARRGFGCFFRSSDNSGRPDARTLHAGAPVKQGQKWIATKWYRERPYIATPVDNS